MELNFHEEDMVSDVVRCTLQDGRIYHHWIQCGWHGSRTWVLRNHQRPGWKVCMGGLPSQANATEEMLASRERPVEQARRLPAVRTSRERVFVALLCRAFQGEGTGGISACSFR